MTCGETFVVTNDVQTVPLLYWLRRRYPVAQDCYWIIKSDEGKDFDVALSKGDTEIDFNNVQVFQISIYFWLTEQLVSRVNSNFAVLI